METKKTPLKIDGINDNIYAGFGPRLGSLLLDIIIFVPIALLVLYTNSVSKNAFLYTLIPNLIFGIWYNVYLVKKYGGTPGKLIMGIKIIKLNGKPLEWKEAILRHSVLLLLSLFSSILMIFCISKADENTYNNLSWLKQSQYLMTFAPISFIVYNYLSNIWVYGELIVLLTNSRKRAVHDFIAGTVIVKKIYVDKINEVMYSNELNEKENN